LPELAGKHKLSNPNCILWKWPPLTKQNTFSQCGAWRLAESNVTPSRESIDQMPEAQEALEHLNYKMY
jgi:hypothetical protein